MVTQALAIPLATELPTPNGRKTCALAIWLLQTQRLPADVLSPAKDRIAYALRRAIEGELGKEGKKGSVSDGLKVKSRMIPQSSPDIDLFSLGHPRSCRPRTVHLRACFHRTPPFYPRQLTWSPTRATSPSLPCTRWPCPRRFTNSPLLCASTALGHCCCDAHRRASGSTDNLISSHAQR
jgi:hypothetical protein